jgi:hypothetical protein
MDPHHFRLLAESIVISPDISLEVSLADDQKLRDLATQTFEAILHGPESPNAAIGALIALAIEATERRITREQH